MLLANPEQMLIIVSLISLDIKFGMKIPKFIEMQPGQ